MYYMEIDKVCWWDLPPKQIDIQLKTIELLNYMNYDCEFCEIKGVNVRVIPLNEEEVLDEVMKHRKLEGGWYLYQGRKLGLYDLEKTIKATHRRIKITIEKK